MSTPIALPLLDRIHVASPCSVRWEDMAGDERVRHCAQCNLSVHNLSAMSRDDAEGVLAGLAQGRVCATFFRRADGTILTQDCPVGLARVRAAARRGLMRVAALVGLVVGAGIAAAGTSDSRWGERVRLRALKPFSVACEWLVPSVPAVTPPRGLCRVAGDISFSPPPPQPPAPVKTNAPRN